MQYKLPIASSDTLGGVKIGETLAINQDGVIDVKGLDELQKNYEEAIDLVTTGKKVVADAITGKGVDTAESASFQTMADNIGKISSGDGKKEGLLCLFPISYHGDRCIIAGQIKEVKDE